MSLGVEGRLSREADENQVIGQALVRSETGWAIQVTAGGPVDAVSCQAVAAGEEQVGKLVGTGGIIPALGGEALAVGDRVQVIGVAGRFGLLVDGHCVGTVDTACAANGDLFNLLLGGSSATPAVE